MAQRTVIVALVAVTFLAAFTLTIHLSTPVTAQQSAGSGCCWPPKSADIVNVDLQSVVLNSTNSFRAPLYTPPANKTFVVTYYEIAPSTPGSTRAVDLVEDCGGATTVLRSAAFGSAWHSQAPCQVAPNDDCVTGGPFIAPAVGYLVNANQTGGCNLALDDPTAAGGAWDVNIVGYLTTR